jgi:phospholipid transport system substrate-binding protein
MKNILFTTVFVLFSSQISSLALAQDAVKLDQVKVFINEVGSQIIKSADDKKLSVAQRKAKIISVIDESIDAEWIARFVLGKNYRTMSEEHKAAFTELYRDFMINTYGPKFQSYNGKRFYVTDVTEQNGFYIAKAEFLPKDSNTAILVSFRVKERSNKLVILDFIAEGISLIETQRSEFNSAISQKGVDKFLEELKNRIEKLKTQKTN